MPAKKKKKATKKSTGLFGSYVQQRDAFYKTHPRARMLLGVLIVAFALLLAKAYYKAQIYGGVSFILSSDYDVVYIPK